jgi:hypothetical protein
MNDYQKLVQRLEDLKCKKCGGTGRLIISCGHEETKKCDGCNETGLKNPPGKVRKPRVEGFKFR